MEETEWTPESVTCHQDAYTATSRLCRYQGAQKHMYVTHVSVLTNGRIAELNAYCNEHPGAELCQISRALHIGLSDVISLINYSDAMNEKPSINPITDKINAARKFYNDEMDQRRRMANRDNSSKLVDDLKRFRRH